MVWFTFQNLKYFSSKLTISSQWLSLSLTAESHCHVKYNKCQVLTPDRASWVNHWKAEWGLWWSVRLLSWELSSTYWNWAVSRSRIFKTSVNILKLESWDNFHLLSFINLKMPARYLRNHRSLKVRKERSRKSRELLLADIIGNSWVLNPNWNFGK